MQTGCHNVHFQLPKMLIDSRKQLLSTAAAISHASGQRMGMRMGRRWRWRWRRGGASNLINVATNGLWRCRLRPVTFYVIKKRAQAGEQQQEIHTHTRTRWHACVYVHAKKKTIKFMLIGRSECQSACQAAGARAAAGDRQREARGS